MAAPPKLDEIQKRLIRAMKRAGRTNADIAKMVGCCPQHVSVVAGKVNVEARRRAQRKHRRKRYEPPPLPCPECRAWRAAYTSGRVKVLRYCPKHGGDPRE